MDPLNGTYDTHKKIEKKNRTNPKLALHKLSYNYGSIVRDSSFFIVILIGCCGPENWKICRKLSPLNLSQMYCIRCISSRSKPIFVFLFIHPNDKEPNQWANMRWREEKLANKFRLITCEREKGKQKCWNNKFFAHPMNIEHWTYNFFTNGEMVCCHILNRYLR